LGWTPETFWRASVSEFFMAIAGFNRGQRGETGQPEPVSRAEAEEMFAAEEARIAKIKARESTDG